MNTILKEHGNRQITDSKFILMLEAMLFAFLGGRIGLIGAIPLISVLIQYQVFIVELWRLQISDRLFA